MSSVLMTYDIAERIDIAVNMDDQLALKAADYVNNSRGLADVRKKLVAQPSPLDAP